MSDAESEPPPPESETISAENFSRHPLWERAAGRGQPAPKNAKKTGGPTFMPISLNSLEAQSRALLDGTSTVAPSEFGNAKKKKKKKKSKKRKEAIQDDEASQKGDEEDADGLGESNSDYSADESVAGKRRRKEKAQKQKHTEESDDEDSEDDGAADNSDRGDNDEAAQAAMLAAAAFGGGSGAGSGAKKKHSTALTVTDEDGASVTSSQLKEAQDRAFPVSGVTCIGCSAPARVQVVTDYIKGSCGMMNDESLFRSAAQVYVEQVCLPAKREGIIAPKWSWRDIKNHFTLHAIDSRLQRHENVRSLAAMRHQLNLSLMRKDDATGEAVLDKMHSELLLKTIAAHSRELSAITECVYADAVGPTLSTGTPGKKKAAPK